MEEKTILIGGINFGMRQFEVMKVAMTGISRKEMAKALNMPDETLNTHMRYVFLKTGVGKITEFINWGHANGFDSKGSYTPKKD